MTAYFQNINTNQVIEMAIGENQPSYSIDLPPGEYIAYVWMPNFVMGGLYSEFVLCGLGADCTDHTPVPFQVESGRATNGILISATGTANRAMYHCLQTLRDDICVIERCTPTALRCARGEVYDS